MGTCNSYVASSNQQWKQQQLDAARKAVGEKRLRFIEQAIFFHRQSMEARRQVKERGENCNFVHTHNWELEKKAISDYFRLYKLFLEHKISFRPKFITQSKNSEMSSKGKS